MNLNNHFGEALRRVLNEKKITQVELANLLGKEKTTINSYLKVKSPHRTSLDAVLAALDLTEVEFYTIGTVQNTEYAVEYDLKERLNSLNEKLANKEKENEELKSKLIALLEKENKKLQEAVQ